MTVSFDSCEVRMICPQNEPLLYCRAMTKKHALINQPGLKHNRASFAHPCPTALVHTSAAGASTSCQHNTPDQQLLLAVVDTQFILRFPHCCCVQWQWSVGGPAAAAHGAAVRADVPPPHWAETHPHARSCRSGLLQASNCCVCFCIGAAEESKDSIR